MRVPQRVTRIRSEADDLHLYFDLKTWLRVHPQETFCRSEFTRQDFKLYALLSTWYESDIVEAAVRNCFTHGCDRVYILDNNSPDNTVALAESAGATLAQCYITDFYRDTLRIGLINEIEERITREESHPRLWWLTLDCDEFIQVPGGLRLRDWLETLDPRCNCVGVGALDHYPTTKPENLPGFHPALFQPYVMVRGLWACEENHWKHPLLCYDFGNYNICHTRGLHAPHTKHGIPLLGPRHGLLVHHMMFREEAFTRARLTALCAASEKNYGCSRSYLDDKELNLEGAAKRFRDLDLIYSQNWEQAGLCHSQPYVNKVGIPVRENSQVIPWTDYAPLIWYPYDNQLTATRQWRQDRGLLDTSPDQPLNTHIDNPLVNLGHPVEGTPDLSLLQFLIFEIGPKCNFCKRHEAACPSSSPERFASSPSRALLTDDIILECLWYAYRWGFHGEIGWHYYNEPLLYWDRLKQLLPHIRGIWPKSRFVLWTNGSLIPDNWQELSIFEDLWISNYNKQDWSHMRPIKATTRARLLSGDLDCRKLRFDIINTDGCLRPFNELVIDCYGYGRLCCADWRREVNLGNVWSDGFQSIARLFLYHREHIRQSPLPDAAPAICRICPIKHKDVGDLVPDVATEIIDHLRKAGNA